MLGERAREGQANLHAFDSADPGETGGSMPPRLAVVAAAGKGARIHPRSAQVPKVMLEAGGMLADRRAGFAVLGTGLVPRARYLP